jgi:segregation and condensation protein B
LKDLNELPSIEEFEKMAGELADAESLDASAELLPFVQGEADDEHPENVETNRDEDDSEVEAAAIAAVGVSEETGQREFADLPGVVVEPEVKPTHMVDAGEATASVGQPGEGD